MRVLAFLLCVVFAASAAASGRVTAQLELWHADPYTEQGGGTWRLTVGEQWGTSFELAYAEVRLAGVTYANMNNGQFDWWPGSLSWTVLHHGEYPGYFDLRVMRMPNPQTGLGQPMLPATELFLQGFFWPGQQQPDFYWDGRDSVTAMQYMYSPDWWYIGYGPPVLDTAPLTIDYKIVTNLEKMKGDFNYDGKVDAADYTVWRNVGSQPGFPGSYEDWKRNYGNTLDSPPLRGLGSGGLAVQAPEPATAVSVLLPLVTWFLRRSGRRLAGPLPSFGSGI